jgi:replication-associated recombination protein RarA
MPLSIPSISSEAGLREELYARALEIPEPQIFTADVSQKWRITSAMQKTIRRGHTHCAIRFATMLHSIDATYCWRRLCVVALEDCFGDPLAVALALEANRSFRFRQQLGELRALAAVVTGLCDGV